MHWPRSWPCPWPWPDVKEGQGIWKGPAMIHRCAVPILCMVNSYHKTPSSLQWVISVVAILRIVNSYPTYKTLVSALSHCGAVAILRMVNLYHTRPSSLQWVISVVAILLIVNSYHTYETLVSAVSQRRCSGKKMADCHWLVHRSDSWPHGWTVGAWVTRKNINPPNSEHAQQVAFLESLGVGD